MAKYYYATLVNLKNHISAEAFRRQLLIFRHVVIIMADFRKLYLQFFFLYMANDKHFFH